MNIHPAKHVFPLTPSRSVASRDGMVLVVVMIVVVIVALASFSFTELMYVEEKAVRLHGDELQLENAIGSGEEFLKSFLEQSQQKIEQLGGLHDNPDLFQAIRLTTDRDTSWQARFSIVSPRVEDGETTGIRFGVENESSRLNLISVNDWEKKTPGSGHRALMSLPGMSESLADSILDWMDEDSQPREMGAEAEYYSSLDPAYAPANKAPNSLEELLFVRGVTRELLWGNDVNYNHLEEEEEIELARSASENFEQNFSSESSLPWSSMLTLYSAERNVTPAGQPRIYLNQANLSFLHEQLAEVFNESWANFIIAYRQYGPASGSAANSSFSAATYRADLSIPAKFKLDSLLDFIEAKVHLPEKGQREETTLFSPWQNTRSSLQENFSKLQDLTTVVETKVISGRININLASKAVLRAVPQIDEELAEQIILARKSREDPSSSSRNYPTWLLAEGLVKLPQMRALAPYLTTVGDVYRGQIISFFEKQGPFARGEMIIDATSRPPRRVYWKNLKVWGRGYSLEMLGAESPRDSLLRSESSRQEESRSNLHPRKLPPTGQ